MNQKDKFECFRAFIINKIKNGTKQTALARNIGCSNSTVHHLVKGDLPKFRLAWQKKAAAFFGLSLADLIKAGEQIILMGNQQDSKNITEEVITNSFSKKPEIHIHIHIGQGESEHVVCA